MPKRIRSLRCPTCRKIVLRSEPEFPFCGERCRLIDLGKWASGGYVLSTPITDPEELMGMEAIEQERRKQHHPGEPSADDSHGRKSY